MLTITLPIFLVILMAILAFIGFILVAAWIFVMIGRAVEWHERIRRHK